MRRFHTVWVNTRRPPCRDKDPDPVVRRLIVAHQLRPFVHVCCKEPCAEIRSLGTSTRILVASPQIASQIGSIEQLARFPALATNDTADDLEWHLEMEDGRKHVLRVEPCLGCEDMAAVRDAAMAGLGVAILPDHVCLEAMEAGRLVRVLPAWRGLQGIVHLVFTTRRGLPPAVRALIDHLAANFPRDSRTSDGD